MTQVDAGMFISLHIGHFTTLSSEDPIGLLIVRNAYSEIELYYYLLVYVHTVYIHMHACTLAIDRDHISYH